MALLLGGGGTELLRSGARDAVAGQDLEVSFVTDRQADLQLRPGSPGSKHISYEDSGRDGISVSIRHINLRARTRFDDLLRVTNTGQNTITAIEASVIEQDGPMAVTAHEETDLTVEPGESAGALGLTIETTDVETDRPDIETTLTVRLEVDTDA